MTVTADTGHRIVLHAAPIEVGRLVFWATLPIASSEIPTRHAVDLATGEMVE